MSVSSTSVKAGPYSADGVQKVFNFGFKAFNKTNVRVVLTSAQGVESDLVLDVDYTVTLATNQNVSPGGYITTVATYATGQKITLVSNQEPTQLVNFTNFRPDVIERAFDKLTLLYQQTVEQLSRAIKTNISGSMTPEQFLSDLFNRVDTAASNAENAASSAGVSAGSATAAASSAQLSATQAQEYAAQAFPFPHIKTDQPVGILTKNYTASVDLDLSAGYGNHKNFVVEFTTGCDDEPTLSINGIMPPLDLMVPLADSRIVKAGRLDTRINTTTIGIIINDNQMLLLNPSSSENLDLVTTPFTITPWDSLDRIYSVTGGGVISLDPILNYRPGHLIELAISGADCTLQAAAGDLIWDSITRTSANTKTLTNARTMRVFRDKSDTPQWRVVYY